MSYSVCFLKLGVLSFSTIGLQLLAPPAGLFLCQYIVTSLFLLTNFGLKYALSDMNIDTSVCFQAPFAWEIFCQPLTVSLCVSLPVKCFL
jgi:hypothetical protein